MTEGLDELIKAANKGSLAGKAKRINTMIWLLCSATYYLIYEIKANVPTMDQ